MRHAFRVYARSRPGGVVGALHVVHAADPVASSAPGGAVVCHLASKSFFCLHCHCLTAW